MCFSSFKERKLEYEVLRAYREAVKNIRDSGGEPSTETLKRIAEIKMVIRIYSNVQITK